jgi:hypothetical protein
MSGTISDNVGRSSGSITEPSGGIEILSSDPTLTEGLVWYNSTSNTLKVARSGGVWSTGGALGTARRHNLGTNGTQSAAFVATGGLASGSSNTSETYDGSSWSAANTSSQTKNSAMHSGTKTAGLLWGGWTGSISAVAEEFDGTSFTTSGVGTLAQGVYSAGGTGVQTATLSVAGTDDSSKFASAEEYNGSVWADGGDLAAGQVATATTGTLTAALTAGGSTGSYLNTAYTYDGTSFASITAISETKNYAIPFGVQTAAIIAGGTTGTVISTVEQWNGSAWSTETSLPEERAYGLGGGDATAGLVIGGKDQSGNTESTTNEWDTGILARTITNS